MAKAKRNWSRTIARWFECEAELHWYEAHGIGKKEMKVKEPRGLKGMKAEQKFAICVQNEGYPVSLELWKVYRVIPGKKAAQHQLIRIIDESGDDYLFDESWFVPIKLPQAAKEAMLAAS